MKKIFLLLICLFTFGCSTNNLSSIGLVSLIHIDYDDEFIINVEVRENEKNNPNRTIKYVGNGKSIEDALLGINQVSNKSLYFTNIDSMIITSNLINSKLNEVLDYLTRSNDFGNNFNVLVSDNSINDIYSLLDNKISGEYIKNLINNSSSNVVNIIYNKFLKDYLNPYRDNILPYLCIDNNVIRVNDAIIFNSNRALIIDNEFVNIYNLLNNINKLCFFNINYKGLNVIYRVKSIDSKIGYNSINTYLVGNINEIENTSLINNIDEIDSLLSIDIKNKIYEFIEVLKINDIDVLGFKKRVYNKTRSMINSISDLNIDIDVNVKIEREQLTFKQIKEVL